ncbi:Rieske 2Fe-2S domain-containing protein [Roseobacter sp. S98]|uniref:Rieske 2Fe-2S domain-containing protein n=1 Tax=Roseobacter algicola (ex Choi et al. 2025) (nom. illeg.) TaxID=3092138 RepID=UPI003F51837E
MTSVAVGLSRDLAPGRVMRAEVQGQDLAVWRDENGGLHAWDNRCPHRGMRLSHGFVRDGHLACLYHGWHYRKDGVCAYIPAHPDLEPPETIGATVFSVTEGAGVIRVSTQGDADPAPGNDAATPLRSLSFFCTPDRALQALRETPFEGKPPALLPSGALQVGDTGVTLHAAPLGDDETMVHVLVGDGTPVAMCKALSRWCEAARDVAEETTA